MARFLANIPAVLEHHRVSILAVDVLFQQHHGTHYGMELRNGLALQIQQRLTKRCQMLRILDASCLLIKISFPVEAMHL